MTRKHDTMRTPVLAGALLWVATASGATWYAAPPPCSTVEASCGTSYANACCTIQHAINRSNNGDTVLVKPGTYTQLIDFFRNQVGKGIIVKKDTAFAGEAILQWTSTGASIVEFNCATNVCGPNHGTLEGFTITGLSGISGFSGTGISVQSASPTILNNTVRANGGTGIYVSAGSPTIRGNTISANGNAAAVAGGGINLISSSAVIEDNLICRNIAADGGGFTPWTPST